MHVDEQGNLSIISQAWLFIAIAFPLTVLTFIVWRISLSSTMKGQRETNTHKEHIKTLFYNLLSLRAVSRVSRLLLWPWKHGREKRITDGGGRVFAPDLESVAVSTTRKKSRHEFDARRGAGGFEEIGTKPALE